MSVRLSTIEANGIRMQVAEAGSGPMVLLCHGFPETWYSWRHQLQALSEAGYRVVAPDMRGYGGTDRPEQADRYTLLHLVGDMVGLLDALGEKRAVIVGHDWGGPVAWNAARMRPDRFRGVISLSTPALPRPPTPPMSRMPQNATEMFYQLYFQEPGVADAELARDVRRTIRAMFAGAGGRRGKDMRPIHMVDRGKGFLDRMGDGADLPAWASEADIDHYVAAFEQTGFTGGLNWYRNLDRSWELLAPFADLPIRIPSLFIAGDHDVVIHMIGLGAIKAGMAIAAPGLTDFVMLEQCGHWTQQERPEEVNAAMIRFLRDLPP